MHFFRSSSKVKMPTIQTLRLILLLITATFPLRDFQAVKDSNEKMTDVEYKREELKNPPDYLQRKSEARNGHPRVETESKRSRRNTGNEAQLLGNVCPGCPSSYTPYFSGQCFLCPPGTPGPRGPPGQQGIPGRDGRDGRDAAFEAFDVANSDTLEPLAGSRRNSNVTGGAVYVRWGKTECPTVSELIYKGVAGGGYYSHKGSGSTYLCLPEEPIYDEPVAGSSGQSRGYVYGAEYQTSTFANWNHLHNNNVPCAVCWASNRPSLIMIPARNICPGSEWTKEYSGYLVSDYYDHGSSTEYVCMDRNPETVPRSVHNSDGALFYIVEGRCGSGGSGLPCGPYIDGYELTCAVCTR